MGGVDAPAVIAELSEIIFAFPTRVKRVNE